MKHRGIPSHKDSAGGDVLEFDRNFQAGRLRLVVTVFKLAGAILVSSKPMMPNIELRVQFLIANCFGELLSPQVFQHPILFIIK
jgi:hypothetical protein